ncbi:MAG TPA: DUF3667 domain-containing protein [Gammaproteobacteria bacterium]|nr:DUF3667 domain-containing protein [Gammaproteobacteria bacterium]
MSTAGECQNCHAALAGPFCGVCGQKGDVRIPTLGHLLADALGDLLNFDSRIWRSLVVLTLSPGRLTRLYLEGKRVRYAPPFRMYIVTSVVFFLLFSFARFGALSPTGPEVLDSIDDSVNATVNGALSDAGVAPPAPAEPDAAAPTTAAPGGPQTFNVSVDDNGRWECQLDRNLEPRFRARLEAACRQIERDNGASFINAFARNFPVMMLVFIPIMAAIMKVLYLFARRKYVEHLLFFLHVHTFFFLTGVVVILVSRAARLVPGLEWPALIVEIAASIYFLLYVYRAMRRVYVQGHLLTSVKYVVLGGSYFVAFLMTMLGLIVYTALTL